MNTRLGIAADELVIVQDILVRFLPPGCRTYVFGSRATGERLKPWSDLDLAIAGPASLTISERESLRCAFDESLLPWKVDIVDLQAVSPEFGRIVRAQMVPLD